VRIFACSGSLIDFAFLLQDIAGSAGLSWHFSKITRKRYKSYCYVGNTPNQEPHIAKTLDLTRDALKFEWNKITVSLRSSIDHNVFSPRLLHVQCSSDICELRIRVLYERILRIHVCWYAHIYAYIRAHMHVYTCVYVSLLCIPISLFMWSIVGQTKDIIFLGMKKASKRNLHVVKMSCWSMKAIISRVFDHFANSPPNYRLLTLAWS